MRKKYHQPKAKVLKFNYVYGILEGEFSIGTTEGNPPSGDIYSKEHQGFSFWDEEEQEEEDSNE